LVIFNCLRGKLVRFNLVLLLWNWYDYLFFYFLIPVILTAFHVLPDDLKDYLILWPLNPTFAGLFFSSYVHLNFNHFLNNLLSYLFVIFFLFNFETDRRLFYRVSSLLLLLLPILSSLLIIFLPAFRVPGVYFLGFSVITSGFEGYSIYAVFSYLRNVLKFSFNSSFILLVFSLNNMIVLLNLKIPSTYQFIMISAFTILLFLFVYSIYVNRLGIKQMMYMLTLNRIKSLFKGGCLVSAYRLLLILLVIKYLFSLPVLIPPEILIGGSVINIFSHYVGYTFGTFTPIIIGSLKWNYQIPSRIYWRGFYNIEKGKLVRVWVILHGVASSFMKVCYIF